MSVCICGLKVERAQDKLWCMICKQSFHPKCFNIEKSDIDLIKNVFKCNSCISERRSSLSHADLPIGVTVAVNADKSGNAECALDLPTATSAKTGSAESSLLSVSGVVADESADISADTSTAELADHLSGECKNIQKPVSGTLAAHDTLMDLDAFVSDGIADQTPLKSAINLLISEMRSLTKSNVDLHVTVRSLRDDNINLVSKVDELQLSLEKLQKSLAQKTNAIDSSPKRKKLRKNSGNNRITPSLPTPAAEPVVANNAESLLLSSSSSSIVLPSCPAFPSYASIAGAKPSLSDNNLQLADDQNLSLDWQSKLNSKKNVPAVTGTTNAKLPLVVGTGVNSDLAVVDSKKWLHISSFKNTVSTDDIIAFIEKQFNIPKIHLLCYKLVKKNQNVSELRFVNFKLGISAFYVNKVLDASLWPANIKIRYFDFLEKQVE